MNFCEKGYWYRIELIKYLLLLKNCLVCLVNIIILYFNKLRWMLVIIGFYVNIIIYFVCKNK